MDRGIEGGIIMIAVKNIFHMLTYVYRRLSTDDYQRTVTETFDSAANLFAQLLAYGIMRQIKSGIPKEYIRKHDILPVMRGRLDVIGTARQYSSGRRRLACNYDEFSENTPVNRILKSTVNALMRSPVVDTERKRSLKRCLWHFCDVGDILPQTIRWSALSFHRHNASSQLLLHLCQLVLLELLPTMDEGDFDVDKVAPIKLMYKLFEDFLRAFCEKHYKEHYQGAKEIAWNLGDTSRQYLPKMKSDLILEHSQHALVIDAKYCKNVFTYDHRYSNHHTLRSAHLYQIYTYIKSLQFNSKKSVGGLLLYARTDEPDLPDSTYRIDGNRIAVATIDLMQDFTAVEQSLHMIIEENLFAEANTQSIL